MDKFLANLILSKDPIEPETLSQLYPALKDIEREIILVTKVIKDTNLVFLDMDVFENCVHVLNGVQPDIFTTEGCLPEQIWYALKYINEIRVFEYSDEVKEYIKWVSTEHGLKFFPPLANFTEEENPLFKTVLHKAINGPFPLTEKFIDIQAMHYLRIVEYMHKKLKGDN